MASNNNKHDLIDTGAHIALLLARLMGQYSLLSGVWRRCLSSSVVCNTAMPRPAAGCVGGRAADTSRRASTVTSH